MYAFCIADFRLIDSYKDSRFSWIEKQWGTQLPNNKDPGGLQE